MKVSFSSGLHPVLDLGERLFNRVKVWAIGLEEPRRGAATDFMASRTARDLWLPRLFMITISPEPVAVLSKQETGPIDRTVKDAWVCQLVMAQGSNENHRAPMPMRYHSQQVAALSCPSPRSEPCWF